MYTYIYIYIHTYTYTFQNGGERTPTRSTTSWCPLGGQRPLHLRFSIFFRVLRWFWAEGWLSILGSPGRSLSQQATCPVSLRPRVLQMPGAAEGSQGHALQGSQTSAPQIGELASATAIWCPVLDPLRCQEMQFDVADPRCPWRSYRILRNDSS